MKLHILIFLFGFHCLVSFGQRADILCAANTLSVTEKICIGITETPVHEYKNYLRTLAEKHGTASETFKQDLPDFEVWASAFSSFSASHLEEKFFETDEMALLPLTSVTLEQVNRFLRWKTEQMEAELGKMSRRERANFPENFRFRLPTAKEWGFMRFRVQDKRMLKQIEGKAKNDEKIFRSNRSKVLKNVQAMQTIYDVLDTKRCYYNVFNNVLEMTREDGLAVGGDSFMQNPDEDYLKTFSVTLPHSRVGFRLIFEIFE